MAKDDAYSGQLLEAMFQIANITSQIIKNEKDFPVRLEQVLKITAEAIGADGGFAGTLSVIDDRMYIHGGYGSFSGKANSTLGEKWHPAVKETIESSKSVYIPDVESDDTWKKVIQELVDTEEKITRKSMVIGLLHDWEKKEFSGALVLLSGKKAAFNDEQMKFVDAVAKILSSMINDHELYGLLNDLTTRIGPILGPDTVEPSKHTAIMDSLADGVMYVDVNGTIDIFTSVAEKLLDISAERAIGRPVKALAETFEKRGEQWPVELWATKPDDWTRSEVIEGQIQRKSGQVIQVRVAPVFMGDVCLGTVSLFQEDTRTAELNKMKYEFVSTIASELRTPLTSMKGYADLLLSGVAGEISEAQQRFLEVIKQNADRLSRRMYDLLDVSKIDLKPARTKFVAVEVQPLFKAIEDSLRHRVEDQKPNMKVKVEIEENLLPLYGDYEQTIQMIHNLTDNAFNYTPDGGTITLRAKCADDDKKMVLLSVTDTGIGIPEEAHDRIFERFFRGEDLHDLVLDTPGTGLGLPIAKSYVELQHGKIWFESQVGKGSTFYVKLPVYEKSEETDS